MCSANLMAICLIDFDIVCVKLWPDGDARGKVRRPLDSLGV